MNRPDYSLVAARTAYKRALSKPYPQGFTITPTWEQHQRKSQKLIDDFSDVRAVISYAQNGHRSGFDSRKVGEGYEERRFAETVSAWKLKELIQLFGPLPSWAQESELSKNLTIDGKEFSNSFFTHLYHYLRIQQLEPHANVILEIGGGYGALARIFKLGKPDCKYILVDLPESLFYADVFLRENFPSATISYSSAEECDFLLVSVPEIGHLSNVDVDLVINTGSFQEMTEEANLFWANFFQKKITTETLYSFNYFLINRAAYGETSEGGISSPICPILDDCWEPAFFKINPPIPTIDSCKRNWLELFARRTSKRSAEIFFSKAHSFPMGTDAWFENILFALWCRNDGEYVEAFIEGCEIFKRNMSFGITNFQPQRALWRTRFGKWISGNYRYLRKLLGLDVVIPKEFIDVDSCRYIGADPGFLRHNYRNFRIFKKIVLQTNPVTRSPITNYSEEAYFQKRKNLALTENFE